MDNNENELKEKVSKAISYKVTEICVPYALTRHVRLVTKNTDIIVSNMIDYPFGLMDTKSRLSSIENAIKNGAQKINIVIQNPYLSFRKYDKIKIDLAQNYDLCAQNNIDISCYLEYRVFTHHALLKACNILLDNNINNVYVSTGHLLDDPMDNLTACILLSKKTKINTIFTSNIWTEKQARYLQKNKITNFNFTNLRSIELINNYVNFC